MLFLLIASFWLLAMLGLVLGTQELVYRLRLWSQHSPSSWGRLIRSSLSGLRATISQDQSSSESTTLGSLRFTVQKD